MDKLQTLKESTLILDSTLDASMRTPKASYRKRSLSQERGSSILKGENNYFCPYTSNKKFELFLDDLFELNLEVKRNKDEIISYVKVIESFYTDKL
jgi:hypothetical protein